MTPVALSRETMKAVPPGGNPHRLWRLPLGEDRTAELLRRSKRTPALKQATRSVSKSCYAVGFTLR
ncbi:MAG: hypothetical protein V7L29_09995 [Nostoc sp.]|uniref:hypothetical protein n=1 Tax=Nostoc sp. TaxID=1180 RepID=UPI002FFA12BA